MFKICQKVVCKDARHPNLVKDKTYLIIDCFVCDCGKQQLIVHNNLYGDGSECMTCGKIVRGINFYRASRFEPIKYDLISNKEIIKEMIPERLDIPEKQPAELQKI